jgi:hypothetical protein
MGVTKTATIKGGTDANTRIFQAEDNGLQYAGHDNFFNPFVQPDLPCRGLCL